MIGEKQLVRWRPRTARCTRWVVAVIATTPLACGTVLGLDAFRGGSGGSGAAADGGGAAVGGSRTGPGAFGGTATDSGGSAPGSGGSGAQGSAVGGSPSSSTSGGEGGAGGAPIANFCTPIMPGGCDSGGCDCYAPDDCAPGPCGGSYTACCALANDSTLQCGMPAACQFLSASGDGETWFYCCT